MIVMTCYDMLWHVMTCYDMLWHVMTCYDMLWHVMTQHWIWSVSHIVQIPSFGRWTSKLLSCISSHLTWYIASEMLNCLQASKSFRLAICTPQKTLDIWCWVYTRGAATRGIASRSWDDMRPLDTYVTCPPVAGTASPSLGVSENYKP